MTPIRIQRSRQHKQISPNGLPIKYVGRPTEWGNPFRVGELSPHNFKVKMDADHCVQVYEQFLEGIKELRLLDEFLKPLKGYNLSCWCKIGEPCHVDVLLKLLNQ